MAFCVRADHPDHHTMTLTNKGGGTVQGAGRGGGGRREWKGGEAHRERNRGGR